MSSTEKLFELIYSELKRQFFDSFGPKGAEIQSQLKSDMSLVTEVDLFVSKLVEKNLPAGFGLYCEENHSTLAFPSVILDPIDGTRELASGIAECSVSLAVMNSPSEGSAFIYNPFTGHLVMTGAKKAFKMHQPKDGPLLGLVSRQEWKKGLHKIQDENLIFAPRGSIAFKLAILAENGCDFVISRRSKNIWDIAAGTLLTWEQGLCLYNPKGLVHELKTDLIEGPLLWCHPSRYEELKRLL